jgi:2-oxo-4-hydroxy-4-carboxy-5-ureidoimidazoline decarboxylase
MAHVVDTAETARQLELIRAHPELAGKAAVRGELTDDSKLEQAGAGLDRCSPEEFERLQRLNREYGEKFDFPFIIAVKGLDRAAILAAIAERLEHSPAEEFAAALAQIHRIAALRLAVKLLD